MFIHSWFIHIIEVIMPFLSGGIFFLRMLWGTLWVGRVSTPQAGLSSYLLPGVEDYYHGPTAIIQGILGQMAGRTVFWYKLLSF